MGVLVIDKEQYCSEKLEELNEFFIKVEKEGSTLLKKVLNVTWHNKVREDAKGVWQGKSEKYNCPYFPARWLMEEDEWPLINSGLIHLEGEQNNKKALRTKLNRIAQNDLMQAMATAFEIEALCRFIKDDVFHEMEPTVDPAATNRADAMIKVDDRKIIVELTSMTKELASRNQRVGVLSVEEMIYQVISKIKDKAENQLSSAKDPVILIISLPPGRGSDQFTAKWAIEASLDKFPKITAVLISDSCLLRSGACYFNNKTEFKFNNKEKDYIAGLLKLNGNLASGVKLG